MDYDELPYHSSPFTETHPDNLAVIGRLFGLAPAEPQHCRVLELGCAAGGNIIPMAWYLPQAQFLGIELSANQAAAGTRLIAELGLKNITIRQHDIREFSWDGKPFDYILAHGVYSWAPDDVRERILDICSRWLAPEGIAYVSYNTLPGWRMRGMLRDVLLFHTRRHANASERVAAAYAFLESLDPVLANLDALSARYLRLEIERLRAAHPSYLYHEYLEEINEPVLFSQFAARAGDHGLRYLAELDLQTMFPQSLSDEAAALLGAITDEIEREQYTDFVRNRNFRQTLLCHADRPVNREVSLEELTRLACFACLAPDAPPSLVTAEEQVFRLPDGAEFAVSHPLTKAALAQLYAIYPDSVSFAHLADEATRQVEVAGGDAFARQAEHLVGELFGLYARQAIGLTPRAQSFACDVPQRPHASALARAQATHGLGHVATPRHLALVLDPFANRLLGYLDGTRTLPELARELVADVLDRRALELPAATHAGDRHGLTTEVECNGERLLAVFARHGLLVPDASRE